MDVAECVADIDKTTMQLIGYRNSSYMLYDDDGYTREYDLEKNCVTLNKSKMRRAALSWIERTAGQG